MFCYWLRYKQDKTQRTYASGENKGVSCLAGLYGVTVFSLADAGRITAENSLNVCRVITPITMYSGFLSNEFLSFGCICRLICAIVLGLLCLMESQGMGSLAIFLWKLYAFIYFYLHISLFPLWISKWHIWGSPAFCHPDLAPDSLSPAKLLHHIFSATTATRIIES